ncbi:MAG: hypothetical protein JXN65_02110 [Clostridia bacterium]|nr:hypothetical protein [Clostridia bacterium]
MKVNVYTKKRRCIYAIALVLLSIFLSTIGAIAIVFQPEPLVFILLIPFFSIIIIIIRGIIKRGDFDGIVIIDEHGINFKTQRKNVIMPWNKVRYITVHDRPSINFVGFFAEGFEKRPIMQNKEYSTFWLIDLNLIDETFIFVEYRENLLEQIKKYWTNEIINEQKLL